MGEASFSQQHPKSQHPKSQTTGGGGVTARLNAPFSPLENLRLNLERANCTHAT